MIILKKRKRCNVQSLATIPRQHMTTTGCERTGNTVQRLFTEEDAAGRHQHWETAVILSHLNLWIEYLFRVNHRRLRKTTKDGFGEFHFVYFKSEGFPMMIYKAIWLKLEFRCCTQSGPPQLRPSLSPYRDKRIEIETRPRLWGVETKSGAGTSVTHIRVISLAFDGLEINPESSLSLNKTFNWDHQKYYSCMLNEDIRCKNISFLDIVWVCFW